MLEPLDITGPLIDLRSNRQGPVDQIYPIVYDELRRRAHWLLARERPDHTLSTTALVHEAYVRLADQTQLTWEDRAHFCAIAARAMRQILVDFARKRKAEKRGGGAERLRLDENELAVTIQSTMVLDLDEALTRLGQIDERMASVVESRFFGGMSEKEIAEVVGVSVRTIRRDWVRARAWLYKELYPDRIGRAGS